MNRLLKRRAFSYDIPLAPIVRIMPGLLAMRWAITMIRLPMPRCPDGDKNHAWYFMCQMSKAGELDRWKTQPIGGEVRPEVWGCCFDEPGCEPKSQDFGHCIEETHVTWLMDSGAFTKPMNAQRLSKATRLSRRMGYEFFVSRADVTVKSLGSLDVSVQVENRGVAPFYYAWPLEVAALNASGELVALWHPAWKIIDLAANQPAVQWSYSIPRHGLKPGTYKILLRARNPMAGGRPLGFANATQDADKPGWLTLTDIKLDQNSDLK